MTSNDFSIGFIILAVILIISGYGALAAIALIIAVLCWNGNPFDPDDNKLSGA